MATEREIVLPPWTRAVPAAGLPAVIRIPLPGPGNLALSLKPPQGWVGKSTCSLFIMENKWKGLRLDYSYNQKTKTVDYHWNRTGFADRFPIANHTPAGRIGATLYQGARAFRYAGRALVVIGVVMDVESIVVASNPLRRSTQVVSAWALAWAGARSVGAVGAEAGSFVEPGIGTAVGGLVFAIAGGVVGYWAGEKAGEYDFHPSAPDRCAGRPEKDGARMSQTLPEVITIDVERRWDGALMQTDDLCPRGSRAALLRYTIDPWPEEGGVPSAIAAAFARGLTKDWLVAGRWFDETLPGGDASFLPAPPRNLVERAFERLTERWPANLIITRSPEIVVQLFDQGWELQYQALLILDPDSKVDPNRSLEALRTLRSWKEFSFPPPTLALIAPGVDGDVALVAADSEAQLSKVLDALKHAFLSAGFVVPHEAPDSPRLRRTRAVVAPQNDDG